MRNIHKYPITKAEKIAALDQAIIARRDLKLIGDIDEAALVAVRSEWYQAMYGSLLRDPVVVFSVAIGVLWGAIIAFAVGKIW